ncbi:MAG: DUF2851 family protein, partial [Parafilimonas sp.]
QFIWQFQYFNKRELQTVDGTPLQIIHPGTLNKNQGPDFAEAKIKIANTLWVGNVELHVQSSHWHQHHHSTDANYSRIILHVVWLHDEIIKDATGETIPTLELQSLVPKILLQKYEHLMSAKGFVPCENFLPILSSLEWMAWKERLMIERLQIKSNSILQSLQQANNHWEEIFWWHLAANFGIKVNSSVFEQVAKSISVNILAKHKNQIHQLEALVLGQANLLHDDFKEDYPLMLQKEYRYLSKKYTLNSIEQKPAFLRMRPANFPTLRLAQLAMLVNQSEHLFSNIQSASTVHEVQKLFNVTANDYWHYHYRFNEAAEYQPKNTGEQFVNNIIINTVVPMLFAYGIYRNEQQWKDKALEWLASLPAEQNNITKKWKQFGVINQNALDSQSLLQLKNTYCDYYRCLDCAAGNKLLRTNKEISSH